MMLACDAIVVVGHDRRT